MRDSAWDFLLAFRRDRVPVRIVGLNPSPSDVTFFRRLLGPNAPEVEAPTLEEAQPHDRTPFPWTLVALTAAAASAIALRALWAPRLEWAGP